MFFFWIQRTQTWADPFWTPTGREETSSMAAPLQSVALAAVLASPPRITGKATLRDVAVAHKYEQDVKRRRMDSVSELAKASHEDSAAAKVRNPCNFSCRHILPFRLRVSC